MNNQDDNYVLIGGNPSVSYTGTCSFTGLRVVGKYKSRELALVGLKRHYEDIGGLFLILDPGGNEIADYGDDS